MVGHDDDARLRRDSARYFLPLLSGSRRTLRMLWLQTKFYLKVPLGVDTIAFPNLEVLHLQGLEFTQRQLLDLLSAVAPSLRVLSLGRCILRRHGLWIDTFAEMRTLGLRSVEIHPGPLLEHSAIYGHYGWNVIGCNETCHPRKCIWQRVLAWINDPSTTAPLSPTNGGGTPVEWADTVEPRVYRCVKYRRAEN
jgi:hypothetical protein